MPAGGGGPESTPGTPCAAALAGLPDELPDGVVVAGADECVSLVNTTAARLLGIDAAAAVGTHVGKVLGLQDLEGRDWWDCSQPYTGLSIRNLLSEQAWYARDGRELLLTARLVRDTPRGPVSRVVIALREARVRARTDRERSDLVATVAHELRSPLTGVKGFTATLLSKWDRFSDSQRLLMLRTVDADADRLTRLITDLLDVARIDSHRLELRRQPVDLGAAARDVTVRAQPGEGRRVDVVVDELPEVWVDPDKFHQILANLVDNALRHGAGDVVVRLRPHPGGGVDIDVEDAGAGIPEQARTRVFMKYWRSGDRTGTGLGLFIVKGLVEAHGGQVRAGVRNDGDVEGGVVSGARIEVYLPPGRPEALDF